MNSGQKLAKNIAASALMISALAVMAEQALGAVQSPASGDNSESGSVPVSRHWSLPFDGSLKGAPGSVSNADGQKGHSDPITVLHLDQSDQSSQTPPQTSGQPPALPSAVTLTPPPSGQNGAQAEQANSTAAIAPSQAASKSDTKSATSVLPNTAPPDKNPSKTAEKLKTSSSNAVNEEQSVKLRPPMGEQSLAAATPKKIITGGVTTWSGPIKVDHIINSLVDKTFENSPEAQKLDKQLKHLSSPSQKAIAITKDGLNDALEYQGFNPSSRAGKLILDKDYKVRNKAWAEYERQKYVDKIHMQVVSSMMQVAEALGISEGSRAAQMLAAGQESLDSLVGKEEAAKTVQGLKAWLNHVALADSSFSQVPWNTIDRNKKVEAVLKEALKQDPVVAEITKKLERYANPGLVKSGGSRVVETTLSAITILGPGFAIPLGAEALDTVFKESTGGSENNKLEKELLLDKRIQSRLKVLSQEATLALDNYRFALVTKNPSLLVFSEEVLGNMTGKANLSTIVGVASTANESSSIVPEIKESKKISQKLPLRITAQ